MLISSFLRLEDHQKKKKRGERKRELQGGGLWTAIFWTWCGHSSDDLIADLSASNPRLVPSTTSHGLEEQLPNFYPSVGNHCLLMGSGRRATTVFIVHTLRNPLAPTDMSKFSITEMIWLNSVCLKNESKQPNKHECGKETNLKKRGQLN